jgi:hypothetical protein
VIDLERITCSCLSTADPARPLLGEDLLGQSLVLGTEATLGCATSLSSLLALEGA